MPKQIVTWSCEVCGHIFQEQKDALRCEQLPNYGLTIDGAPVMVGDYVTCSAYGWHKSKDHTDWYVEVAPDPKSENRFDHMTMYHPIWRVVHVGLVGDHGVNRGRRYDKRHKFWYLLWCAWHPIGGSEFRVTSTDHFHVGRAAAPKSADKFPTPPFDLAGEWRNKYSLA